MSILILIVSVAAFTACLVHEGGHYLAALLLTRKRLHFKFSPGRLGGKIPIPRFTWVMPWTPDRWRREVIAMAGFGLELLVAIILVVIAPRWTFAVAYTMVSLIHLFLYRFYAGEASDFKWLY